MSLVEIPARGRQGERLVGVGLAKIVVDGSHYAPEFRETMSGRLEVGIDRKLELAPGDVVALAPDGSGAVVLHEAIGPWDDSAPTYGPLRSWLASWAADAYDGPVPDHVTRHAG
ncbi:MAG: hypothetical protein M3Z06_14555 [Actinomycetota bacterium]|nr:hypothetical protein [Actinomycetota bacterium]